MMELIHTSAPKGLDGSRPGYTVVRMTEGMPKELVPALVAASATGVQRIAAGVDPEPFAVYRIWRLGGDCVAISRIVPVTADYSGRPARLAHHYVLSGEEASGASVAAVLCDRSLFRDAWNEEPTLVDATPPPAVAQPESRSAAVAALERCTAHHEEWLAFLASRATRRAEVPDIVLLPHAVPIRLILAAVAAGAERATDIGMGTSEDHVADARPSLVFLRAPIKPRSTDVLADWSAARGESAPPDQPDSRRAARRPATHAATPELELGELPPPVAVASAWAGAEPSSPDGAPAHGASAAAPPAALAASTAEALSAYAVGTIVGLAIGAGIAATLH
jgi:hypothetical protein